MSAKKKNKQVIQCANKKCYTNWYPGENSIKKKRLKTYVLLENNQLIMHAESKEKIPTELIKFNIRVLNILSRAKYEYIQSQKKHTKVST